MGINSLVERIKSSRNAIAAGVLAIAAGGGAYFYFVYQPQMQSQAAAAKPPVARKPQPAPPKPVAKKPVSVQPTVPAPVQAAVSPSVSPSVSPAQQSVITPVATAGEPAPETAVEPPKPEPVVQKDQPKKRKAATKRMQATEPEQMAKPEQVAAMDNKPETAGLSQQVAPEAQDVLLEPASVKPAPAEPATQRGGTTPKYNDIMTAVLRGDREAAKQLLDLGWWVDKPSANGITPLMAAVMNRDTQMVQLLLEHGAEPSVQALRLARKNKDAATASLLEQKGAK